MNKDDITNAIGRNRGTSKAGKGRVSRRATEPEPTPKTPVPKKQAKPRKAPVKSMKRSTTTVNLYEYQVKEIDKITDRLKELGWGRAARIHFMRASIAVMLEKIKPSDLDEIIRSEADLEKYMRENIFT